MKQEAPEEEKKGSTNDVLSASSQNAAASMKNNQSVSEEVQSSKSKGSKDGFLKKISNLFSFKNDSQANKHEITFASMQA
jgi:hypothetical protein